MSSQDTERAKRIRALMDERGWGFQRLADEVGVNKGTVEGWIYKKTRPNYPHLARLAELFGTTPGWLETGDEAAAPADPIDTLRHSVDQIRGQVTRNNEQIRFLATLPDRITALEDAVAAGRSELAAVAEQLSELAQELLMPAASRELEGVADRRRSEGPVPDGGERRASTGRRATDPPPG